MEGRMNMSEFWKNINTYYKRYGLHATIVRIMDKLTGQSRVDYMTWYQKTKPTKQVLKIQASAAVITEYQCVIAQL